MRARGPESKRLRGLDRLSALSLIALAVGCAEGAPPNGKGVAPKKASSRVNAVAAEKVEPIDPNEFCEPWSEADAAKDFVYPKLSAGEGGAGKKRWINVWATWCKPCVEELPRLVDWREKMVADGIDFDLVLLSADGDTEVVADFRKQHGEVEGSLEIEDAEQMGPWLTSIGLPESSVLPIHLFVDGSDKVRCVRMAGVGESDFAAVKQILQQI